MKIFGHSTFYLKMILKQQITHTLHRHHSKRTLMKKEEENLKKSNVYLLQTTVHVAVK